MPNSDELGDDMLMWYWVMEHRDTFEGCYGMALVHSKDGYAWEKPVLNLVERGGTKANNVVKGNRDTVALNPVGSPDEIFILLRCGHMDDPSSRCDGRQLGYGSGLCRPVPRLS